jgi:hypothetical protein
MSILAGEVLNELDAGLPRFVDAGVQFGWQTEEQDS